MTDSLTITLAQLNPRVGDIAGHLATLRRVRAQAAAEGAGLVLTPELCLPGYPPEDLVDSRLLRGEAPEAVEGPARATADCGPPGQAGPPALGDAALGQPH